jgi:hypothetical protein
MQSWNEVRAQQERHKDAVRLAERDRLVLHELALREKGDSSERIDRRAMAWLGRGLISWGWRMLEYLGPGVEVGATE